MLVIRPAMRLCLVGYHGGGAVGKLIMPNRGFVEMKNKNELVISEGRI